MLNVCQIYIDSVWLIVLIYASCVEQSTHFPELTALSPVADVVRALSHHDPNRVMAAADMIRDQCADIPAKRVAYAAARAIPSLVDALRAHPDHAGVVECSCRAQSNICIKNEADQVCRSCPNINDSFS